MARAVLGRDFRPDWQAVLGMCLSAQGRASEALTAFGVLTQREPHVPEHWINVGNCYLHVGAPDTALACFEKADALGARGVELELGRGLALFGCGRFPAARLHLERAYTLDGARSADVALPYAQCLCEMEEHELALPVVRQIRREQLRDREVPLLAWVQAQVGMDVEAEQTYTQHLAAHPTDADARVEYALLLERLNRVEDAFAQLSDQWVALSPDSALKCLAWARVRRRQRDLASALEWADRGREAATGTAVQAMLHFEVAKLHDLRGASDSAMAALQAAHACVEDAMRARGRVSQPSELSWLRQALTDAAPSSWTSPMSDGMPADPVFLVGFPRSGTTLLENILNSHAALVSMDERPALEAVIAEAGDVSALHDLGLAQVKGLRQLYWREVHKWLDYPGDRRLVDKYPLYLTRLPYIARLFPSAAILVLLRHPCDCVLSCYMQDFGSQGGAASFATLEGSAVTYAEVMSHWLSQRDRVALETHSVRYEDLVQDPEGQLGRIFAFLRLAPDQGLLDRPALRVAAGARIRTPSYHQVAEPLHARAVERWRRYRPHFNDRTLRLLEPFVREFGYSLD